MITSKTLGRFRLQNLLGIGAMGLVYEGFDEKNRQKVAIKTLHKTLLKGSHGQEIITRFQREAQTGMDLKHPNIVSIYEYHENQGQPYIVMEWVQGVGLHAHIRPKKPRFELSRVVLLLCQTLDAMAYMHNKGVIHQDMKPANIIVLENDRIKISDFGIARLDHLDGTIGQTHTKNITGTPSYMSPERLMGQTVNERSDLFAIGVILYELLTLEKPFPGKEINHIVRRILNEPFKKISTFNLNLPTQLDPLLEKALAKRPANRFQSAELFREALKQACQ